MKLQRFCINLMNFMLLLLAAERSEAGVAVIVHPASQATSIDLETTRRIWLGKELRLPSTGPLVPIEVAEGSRIRGFYLEKILNKSPEELRKYWARLMFTGKATPPQAVGLDPEVVNLVAKEKNAIGIVEKSFVTKDVKVIGTID